MYSRIIFLSTVLLTFSFLSCSHNGSYYPNSGYDPYPSRYDSNYHGGYKSDWEYERERREERRLERERLELERERLEFEKKKHKDYYKKPHPRPVTKPTPYKPKPKKVKERCPSGFTPSTKKCSKKERKKGCKDMRTSGGLACVSRSFR